MIKRQTAQRRAYKQFIVFSILILFLTQFDVSVRTTVILVKLSDLMGTINLNIPAKQYYVHCAPVAHISPSLSNVHTNNFKAIYLFCDLFHFKLFPKLNLICFEQWSCIVLYSKIVSPFNLLWTTFAPDHWISKDNNTKTSKISHFAMPKSIHFTHCDIPSHSLIVSPNSAWKNTNMAIDVQSFATKSKNILV